MAGFRYWIVGTLVVLSGQRYELVGETAKLHSDLEALVGSTIHDRYEVETLLGTGGMGAVFKARHTGLQRGVAIKVLHPEIGRDESVSKRFDREAHSASRLDHPNCVRVTDFGTTENGTKYLVMELLEGGDLDGRLGRPWAPEQALATIEQVLYGLEHAHAVGIVHRDLKPENIFVTKDFKGEEVVKIVDFGIAKLIDEQGSEKLTRQGIVFGTPRYMSPEQAAGGKIDERTDLYAVGLILYELLAGHPPFETDDAAQLLRMQIMAPPPPLPDSVPAALAKVVEKLLEKSKMDRFASAREVLDALEQAKQALVAPAPAVTRPIPVAAAPVAAAGTGSVTAGDKATTGSTPASSGAAWQPAVSGATLAAPAADLAAVSMSAHAGVSPTGSHASGPFPSMATGSHASLGTGPQASGLGLSQPSMTVATVASPGESPNSRSWIPIALAAVTLLVVFAGVGVLLSSLGEDDAGASKTETTPAAVGQNPELGNGNAAEQGELSGDDAKAKANAETNTEAAERAPVPGPVRSGESPPPSRPARKSNSNSGTDSKPAQPKSGPSNGGSPEPGKASDASKPSDSSSDPAGNPSGVDPEQAKKAREAAAEQERREREAKQREAEQDRNDVRGKDKEKGKGKGHDKKKSG